MIPITSMKNKTCSKKEIQKLESSKACTSDALVGDDLLRLREHELRERAQRLGAEVGRGLLVHRQHDVCF